MTFKVAAVIKRFSEDEACWPSRFPGYIRSEDSGVCHLTTQPAGCTQAQGKARIMADYLPAGLRLPNISGETCHWYIFWGLCCPLQVPSALVSLCASVPMLFVFGI